MIINSYISGSGSFIKIEYPVLSGTYTYNGSEQTPTFTNYDPETSVITGTYSATNAGTYTATFSPRKEYCWSDGTWDDYSITWTINKADAGVTSTPTAKGGVYISTAVALVNAGTCSGGTLYYKASSSSQTSYGTGIPTATTAGTYTVYYYVKGDDNHNDTSEASVSSTVLSTADVKRVGGRIFYDNGSNGVTYKFYTSAGAAITDTSISGLANAYYYYASSYSPSTARWYVYDNTTHTQTIQGTSVTAASGFLYNSIKWGYKGTFCGATTNSIGSGKTNTAIVLNKGVPTDVTPNIWGYIQYCNNNSLNGCNDWFIASGAEQNKLRISGLVDWYASNWILTSVEVTDTYTNVLGWRYDFSSWGYVDKYLDRNAFAARSF